MTVDADLPQTLPTKALGDRLVVRHAITDRDGAVVDLTDFTAKWILVNERGTTAASSMDSPATVDITWPDRAGGIVVATVDEATTVAFTPGTFRFELQLTDGDGVPQRSAFGYVAFEDSLVEAAA